MCVHVYEQALVYFRPNLLKKNTVIRHVAMKLSTSSRVENLLIREANEGLLM